MPDITISGSVILWGAGAIITLAAAYKIIYPWLSTNSRLIKVEKSTEDIKDAVNLLCEAMVALIDNRLTDNNKDNLKAVKAKIEAERGLII